MKLTALASPAAAARDADRDHAPARGRAARAWRRAVRAALLLVLGLALLAASFVAGAILHRNGTLSEYLLAAKAHLSPGYWLGLAFATDLPDVRVDMKFRDFQKISSKRDEALRNRILDASDDDLVKADWTFRGETLRAKMRLKGDWVDHLSGDKWSYRVHLSGDGRFLGMRHFSIQHPAARNYLYEWAYLENLRAEGLIAPRYDFVNVVFNGRKLGIYAVEEHFSKELLEAARRREGPIVKFDEDTLWKQRIHNAARTGPYTDRFLLQSDDGIYDPNAFTAPASAFGAGAAALVPDLKAQHDAALGLLRGYTEGRLAASAVFDPEPMGKFLAVVELWSAEHQLDWHNLRFYYDPLAGKLEPIGFDAEPPAEPATTLLGPATEFAVLDDPLIGRAYLQALRRMTAPEYRQNLHDRLEERYASLAKSLFWEFGTLPEPWPLLEERARLIGLELDPVKELVAYLGREPETSSGAPGWVVQIRNVSTLPVEVGAVEIEGSPSLRALDLIHPRASRVPPVPHGDAFYLPPTRATMAAAALEYVTLRLPPGTGGLGAPATTQAPATPASDGGAPAVHVSYRLAGDREWRRELVVPYAEPLAGPVLVAPDVAEATRLHPFLACTSEPRACTIRTGTWDVAGNLILPDGTALVVEPGTTLRFDAEASLVATGPLRLEGTEAAPIVLEPKDAGWQGLYVARAGGPSTLRSVTIRKTTGVRITGLGITGGVTFFESPLTATGCHFDGSRAEDALNLVRTRATLTGTELADTASDAIDGDFSEVHVTDAVFHDIHGDCLDVSGSTLDAERITAIRIGDTILSAGEGSTVRFKDVQGEEVGIGIAAKDRSRVEGTGLTVKDARSAALAAYTRKAEYGPATVLVTGFVESGSPTQRTLVDLKSVVQIDDERIEGKAKLDLKELDKTHALGH